MVGARYCNCCWPRRSSLVHLPGHAGDCNFCRALYGSRGGLGGKQPLLERRSGQAFARRSVPCDRTAVRLRRARGQPDGASISADRHRSDRNAARQCLFAEP